MVDHFGVTETQVARSHSLVNKTTHCCITVSKQEKFFGSIKVFHWVIIMTHHLWFRYTRIWFNVLGNNVGGALGQVNNSVVTKTTDKYNNTEGFCVAFESNRTP